MSGIDCLTYCIDCLRRRRGCIERRRRGGLDLIVCDFVAFQLVDLHECLDLDQGFGFRV